jgi:hypothetical protein
MTVNALKQHTYGSGEISFARYNTGTQVPGARRYLGNTTDFSFSSEIEKLEHFDSDHGIKEKDDSITTQTKMSGTVVTDNINKENLALLLLGSASIISQSSGTGLIESIAAIQFGTYQLGANDTTRPTGYRNISTVVVKNASGGPTTYVAGTDYVVDTEMGTVRFIEGGTIAEGNPAYITYNVAASTREQIISGNTSIDGALWFKSFNARGPQHDYFLPYVSLSPDGDFNLKGDDWQAIPFALDIQKKGDMSRVYCDGRSILP